MVYKTYSPRLITVLYTAFLYLLISVNIGCSQRIAEPYHNDCEYKQEIDIVNNMAKSGGIFLFGEVHGTVEAPSFVANFACKVAQDTQNSTIVLLELPIPEALSNPAVTTGLSIGQAQELILNEGSTYWTKDPDGRTSIAMMDAIIKILKLKEQGLNIYLGGTIPHKDNIPPNLDINLTFADEYKFKNPYFREAIQILSYKEKFDNVIVLNGSVHIKNHLRFFDKIDAKKNYLGFLQAYGGGTEWNCRYGVGCGSRVVKPTLKHLVDIHEDASLVLKVDHLDVFDGVFVFNNVNSSPPYIEIKSNEKF